MPHHNDDCISRTAVLTADREGSSLNWATPITEKCMCVLCLNVQWVSSLLEGNIRQHEILPLDLRGHGSGRLPELTGLGDEWQWQPLSKEALETGSNLISADVSDVKDLEHHSYFHKMTKLMSLSAGWREKVGSRPAEKVLKSTCHGVVWLP